MRSIAPASITSCARQRVRHVPADLATSNPTAHAKLPHQTALFADEAGQINLQLERDVRHYITLRLRFPNRPLRTMPN